MTGRTLREILEEWFASADPAKHYPQTDPQVSDLDVSHDMLSYTTQPCIGCDKSHKLILPVSGYVRWKVGRELVQDAFPLLPPSDREMLISGTCKECFARITDGDDDE